MGGFKAPMSETLGFWMMNGFAVMLTVWVCVLAEKLRRARYQRDTYSDQLEVAERCKEKLRSELIARDDSYTKILRDASLNQGCRTPNAMN